MTSEVIKTRSGFKMRFRDENGNVVRIKPGRVHLPPNPERRSRVAVQEVFRQMYEAQQAAKA